MAGIGASMYLYNLSLQKPTGINKAIFGNFSAPKAQEIVVARGKILELLRPDDETGKIQSIVSTEVFGIIRTIAPFRLVGGNLDYIIVGSDSGKITVLQFKEDSKTFLKVHEETFGKSGVRRIVPGQYLASDPKGRAVMIGAIEKQKLVYVLNRDSQAQLTISSPLEAHKSHTLLFSMTGLDVGFENPKFACLEVDYEGKLEPDTLPDKFLTYYELDLGLNNVTRKWSEKVDPTANLLITVPGGNEGPGGVLVCSENYITYWDESHEPVRTAFPRRMGILDERGILIVSHATHVQKNLFFFLVQSEFGDIYKVTLQYDLEAGEVQEVQVKYFDTIPTSVSICVLKTGFLFSASECGNHYLFQFRGIGDDSDETASTNSKSVDLVHFLPRAPHNLLLIDEMESLATIQDLKVVNLVPNEDTPQIYTLCGRGARASLRVLRHGLAVSEIAVSELPGHPTGVWAVKTRSADENHKYIVVSFINATIVLQVGETVTEVQDSGIIYYTETLMMGTLFDNSIVQIHPQGFRQIYPDKRQAEWKLGKAGTKTVKACAMNSRQIVIAVAGGQLIYFTFGGVGGQQLSESMRKDMNNEICSLAIAPVPEGRNHSQFLVVGLANNQVKVISLDFKDSMRQLTLHAMPNRPHSIALVTLPDSSEAQGSQALFLYVGLDSGVLIRSRLDDSDGNITDTRRRFIGSMPVKLRVTQVQGQQAVMAMSSRSWLSYSHQARFHMTPLSYELLEDASPFSSPQCSEGMVCVAGNTLRILMNERLGEMFNQTVVPLRYTPRKMLVYPGTNELIVIETDHNAFSEEKKKALFEGLMETDAEGEKKEDEADDEKAQDAFVGAPQAGDGQWGSCIRVINPREDKTSFLLELQDNEAAFSMCICEFKKKDGSTEQYLAVGTVKDMQITPARSHNGGFIHIYQFVTVGGEDDKTVQLKLYHRCVFLFS